MSIRASFKLFLAISENVNELKELGNTPPWIGTFDGLDDGGMWRQRILAGATDVLVNFNGLSNVRLLALKASVLTGTMGTVSFKKNSTGGEITYLRPLGTGSPDAVFLATTDLLTKIYVTNAGTTDIELTVAIGGMV